MDAEGIVQNYRFSTLRFKGCMYNGAEENQAHHSDYYGLRVQEQPLFLGTIAHY